MGIGLMGKILRMMENPRNARQRMLLQSVGSLVRGRPKLLKQGQSLGFRRLESRVTATMLRLAIPYSQVRTILRPSGRKEDRRAEMLASHFLKLNKGNAISASKAIFQSKGEFERAVGKFAPPGKYRPRFDPNVRYIVTRARDSILMIYDQAHEMALAKK